MIEFLAFIGLLSIVSFVISAALYLLFEALSSAQQYEKLQEDLMNKTQPPQHKRIREEI